MTRRDFIWILGLIGCAKEKIQPEKMGARNWFSVISGSFSPAILSPYLWVDAINGSFVSTVDNNGTRARGNIIDSATAQTGQSLTNSGTLSSKAVYNGEGWYMEPNTQFSTGVNSDYNFIHNGSDFEIFLTYFQCLAIAGDIRGLLNNNGFGSTDRGILLYYDNTSSLNSLKLRIGNGTSSVISLTMNGAITQNATNKIRVAKSGNTVTVYVNGVQKGTQTNTGWSASNAISALQINTVLASTAHVYLKDLVIFNRALTASEVTQMNARTFTTITPTDINVYLFAGDSNCAGRGTNSQIAADLTGTISGAYTEKFSGNSPDASSYLGKLELGVNQTLASETPSTQHGLEMRFCKSMGAISDTLVLKYGRGSTALVQSGSTDWNAASSGECYALFKNGIAFSLFDIVHAYRRNPVFRGFIWSHGANDAVVAGAGAQYKTNFIAMFNGVIDFINSSVTNQITGATGYSTSKLRLFLFETRSGGSGFDATSYANVVAAQQDIGTNYLTDNPSYSTKVLASHSESTEGLAMSDTIHYTTASYDTLGANAAAYFDNYVNE